MFTFFSYDKVFRDLIKDEILSYHSLYNRKDRLLLRNLFKEINSHCNTRIRHLVELDTFDIPGAGKIVAKYIAEFSSESIKAYMLSQMVSDRVDDCDKLLLDLYTHFKDSSEYISKPGMPSAAHIYVRYDNAFKKLKPKRMKNELLKLAYCPRDVYYLPLTMQMLASWKIPELQKLLIAYSSTENITVQDINIEEACSPSLLCIRRELRFTAIKALRHYPTDDTKKLVEEYLADPDADIRAAAEKTIKCM